MVQFDLWARIHRYTTAEDDGDMRYALVMTFCEGTPPMVQILRGEGLEFYVDWRGDLWLDYYIDDTYVVHVYVGSMPNIVTGRADTAMQLHEAFGAYAELHDLDLNSCVRNCVPDILELTGMHHNRRMCMPLRRVLEPRWEPIRMQLDTLIDRMSPLFVEDLMQRFDETFHIVDGHIVDNGANFDTRTLFDF